MASTIIHLAIAKKVQEKVKVKNLYDFYLGATAPDISKLIGQTKDTSHFLINTQDSIPNMQIFVKRYPLFKYNSFDLGYYTHLYTDKVWQEEFLPKHVNKNVITLLDGTTLKKSITEINQMIYSDYTNLNTKVIENYDLDLSLFYEEFKKPKTSLKEIPVDKLDILLNKIGIIIENSKEEKTYTFDIDTIKDFIDTTSETIIKEIQKY